MPYAFIEEIARADIAFNAWGATIEEMFAAAADATINVMVDNLDKIDRRESREFELEAEGVDMLLFSLLQELIWYKDAEEILLRTETIETGYEEGRHFVRVRASGEKIDPSKHDLIVDVKAVTLHMFKVEQTPRGWETLVILDI